MQTMSATFWFVTQKVLDNLTNYSTMADIKLVTHEPS